jgi:glycosyltransferase involved in cell wall biosynthesis
MSVPAPLVTLGIPTYNRPEALARVVSELLAQSYANIEIVVADDGDSKRTREALGPLLERIRYLPNPVRLGLYPNWNRVIELARGELIGVFHDHDSYGSTLVERAVELFTRRPSVGLVHCAVRTIGGDGARTDIIHDFDELTPGHAFARRQVHTFPSFVAHGALIVKRELYQRLGAFDPSFGVTADMEMLIRFALAADVGYIHEVLYEHRLRQQGDALFDFSWEYVEASIASRKLNIERVYPSTAPRRAAALAHLQFDAVTTIVRYLLWLDARDEHGQVEVGLELLRRHGSPVLQFASRLMLTRAARAQALRARAFAIRQKLKGRLP